jgi:glycerophosphoryl diester phosphodiesterase
LGVDIVELDVRETLDGYLVLLHDETVDRTTTGHGPVAKMNYSELRRLFLRERDGDFDAPATRERVPTLAEAFQVARGRILINIDDKIGAYHKVVGLAEKMRMTDHLILKREIPFSREDYNAMAVSEHVHFMPKITQGTVPLSEAALEYGWTAPVAFEIKFREESYIMEGADAIGRMNARIWASTLSSSPEKSAGHIDALALRNPHAHWGQLVTMGVSMIQTDEPGPLIRFLESRGLRPALAAR